MINDDQRWVQIGEVLDLIDGFTMPPSPDGPPLQLGEVIDALHEQIKGMVPRPIPDNGRRVVAEFHGPRADDLRYIESVQLRSAVDSLRWALRVAAAEAAEREGIAQAMARKLKIDVADARAYVELDRDKGPF